MTHAILTRRTLLFAAAALTAIGPASAEQATVTREDVKAGLADGSITLIDVREQDEFDAGHIAGATLMPMSSFDPAKLPKSNGKRIVFYCHSGRRAGLAATQAEAAGRSDIAVYAGSMNDWLAAGEPVEK